MYTGGIIQTSSDGMQPGYVLLTAVPVSGYTFKHFIIDGQIVTENPHVTNGSYEAVFYVTMSDFLKNSVPGNASDASLVPISIRRGFSIQDDAATIDERKRDLATADLYALLASSPSSYTGSQESDFYWSHKGASYSMTQSDKNMLLKMANDIYRKYGEPTVGNTINLINL